MALILLNPGLRPLGQFDLEDDNSSMSGGEYVELVTLATSEVSEGYAADVGTAGGSGLVQNTNDSVQFALAQRTVGNLGGLADEGSDDYGTLFGTAIGGTAGGGTGLGTQSTRGVVTLGPRTSFASGKVTVWHMSGLYGVTSGAFSDTSAPSVATAVNTALYSDDNDGTTGDVGKLTTVADSSGQLAINVGMQRDRSLVSTTSAAVGATADNEHLVVYYLGNSQA